MGVCECMKMSITRALNEVKLLDAKIQKKINGTQFIDSKMAKAKNVNSSQMDADDFINEVKSSMQSINDLIKRRKEIKSKIVESNASTVIEVAGKKMTVADAIERKTSVGIERCLLSKMERDLRETNSFVSTKNEQLEDKIERFVSSLVGSDKKDVSLVKTANELAENTRKNEEFKFIDPLNLKNVVEELSNEILEFESNVDFVLSESNSITTIEIED